MLYKCIIILIIGNQVICVYVHQACQTQIAVRAAKSVSLAKILLAGRRCQNIQDSSFFKYVFSVLISF
jgi:hypothetical protein